MEKELEELAWQLLSEEGITKEDIELVDLRIAFSPVIPLKNDYPYKVIETIGGNYLIIGHPILTQSISPDVLKVMRYRYLTRGQL